ncbi:MAG TPA: response regulator [Chloroflexi bacterium]|nr:response regulator [Chloroflexota bacterium]
MEPTRLPVPDTPAPARVLVIDDSEESREFLAEYILAPNGYEPILARDGAEGLRKALTDAPDVILLDLEMPRMNGIEVLEALRQRQIEIPVILMTGHGSEEAAVEVFRLGVRDYVIKPFKLEEMLTAIKRALVEARLRQERDELLNRLMQANQQLERRLQELNTLYGIGKSVTALLDQEKLLTRIVDAAVFITGADEGTLMLADPVTGKLIHQAVRRKAEEIQLIPAKLEKMAIQVIETRRPAATQATLYVPLLLGGRTLGALGVNNVKTSRPFTSHDRRLLQMLADYAAIALENARLFRELEAQKEEEKAQIRRLFERYVAPAVVERIMANPDEVSLGGVRQTVTILFADIREFTTISHRLPPEVLVDVLNRHISVVAKAILREEGTLDKFMGDAVMAFFNAPLPQPDHALRAVRAAVALQKALNALHQRLPEPYRLQFGVGLSTGEAVVGHIGTLQQMNYTVIGDCVNLAQRLQAKAKGGQVFLCQRTYAAVRDHVRVQPMGPMPIKGYSQPEPVFQLLGLK